MPRWNIPQRKQLSIAIATAFTWLETRGLIVPDTGMNGASGFKILTPRGQELADKPAFDQFKLMEDFPATGLHPRLQGQIWKAAIRGEFDNAVAQAFKLLEERVRAAGKFASGDIGVTLMRAAFKPGTGPLTDKAQEPGEQQGVSDLFAGASGAFRNPSAHRTVPYNDISEVQRLLMFVSLLLSIVDARAP
jgi:uncharacterized protein (TIGR02391 family)